MPPALYPLRRLQVGKEGTAGKAVPATQQVIGEHEWTPVVDRYVESYPRGVRVRRTTRDADQQRGSRLVVNTDCDFEHFLVPLTCGLQRPTSTRETINAWASGQTYVVGDKRARSGSFYICIRGHTSGNSGANGPPGSGDATAWEDYSPIYTHVSKPNVAAGLTIDTLTAEYRATDGAMHHYEREFAYGIVERLRLTWASGQPTKLSYTVLGRREEASSITNGVGVVAGREIIPSALWSLAIDDTWGDLGDTDIEDGHFRAGGLEIITGARPRYGMAGRADLDMNGVDVDLLAATLNVTLTHDAVAAGEFQHWRDDDLRYVRLHAESGDKSATIDLCGAHTAPPAMGQDGQVDTLALTLALEHDPASTNRAIAATLANRLATF